MVSVTVSGDAWVGKFASVQCEVFWGKNGRERGRRAETFLLKRVLFTDVHYTLAGVKKITGLQFCHSSSWDR